MELTLAHFPVREVAKALNCFLEEVLTWMRANRLKLNIGRMVVLAVVNSISFKVQDMLLILAM